MRIKKLLTNSNSIHETWIFLNTDSSLRTRWGAWRACVWPLWNIWRICRDVSVMCANKLFLRTSSPDVLSCRTWLFCGIGIPRNLERWAPTLEWKAWLTETRPPYIPNVVALGQMIRTSICTDIHGTFCPAVQGHSVIETDTVRSGN